MCIQKTMAEVSLIGDLKKTQNPKLTLVLPKTIGDIHFTFKCIR